ncbi:hypothetical protein [Litchfieldella qijiaojingensis]|uniref:hypothetical protein n=1 Tax=Litchfieldella qijiaojingensis TaxID=980347 RepID=UPI00167B7A7F|nr:hypothetical protein [Halomonas qijiaojingensis]
MADYTAFFGLSEPNPAGEMPVGDASLSPIAVRSCPSDPFWRLDILPAGNGSEHFVCAFANTLTGDRYPLEIGEMGPDATMRRDHLSVIFAATNDKGFRNTVKEAQFDPQAQNFVRVSILYKAQDPQSQIRIVAPPQGGYLLALCVTAERAIVLRIAIQGPEEVQTIGADFHPRVLATGNGSTLILGDLRDGKAQAITHVLEVVER